MTFATLSFLQWLALSGGILLVMALASAHLKRLPISSSLIYLGLGWLIGPQALGWIRIDLEGGSAWFERLTEIAVIISLFIGGLKLRLSPRDPAWSAAYRLAGPVMLASIAGIAVVARLVLGLAPPHALLLGAILAPTDPVLASAVSVGHAADKDRMRYGLSGEAGLNDGMAFPFVVLALRWMEQGSGGAWVLRWALVKVAWAVPAALVLGYGLGVWVGRWAIRLRSRQRDTEAPSDFLALALIALSYVAADILGAWGFVAVFAAGVGLRRAELKVVAETPHPQAVPRASRPDAPHPPAEHLVGARVEPEAMGEPAVAAGVLVAETISFGATAERLLEVALVTLVGVLVGPFWSARALVLAAVLLFLLRPAATRLLLAGTATSPHQRWLMGWFGIRGIGSLYYVAYALNRGLSGDAARDVLSLTLSVVTVSIVLHGITATPLLNRYQATLKSPGRAA
ncbi:sodium:proton antiporter [Sorangium sp. So ce119]|uniref:cation:proton antiporter n=1 Tax=Sorangium sp. So ce119 TaxID=3133279 RepID=UPI003F630BDE